MFAQRVVNLPLLSYVYRSGPVLTKIQTKVVSWVTQALDTVSLPHHVEEGFYVVGMLGDDYEVVH